MKQREQKSHVKCLQIQVNASILSIMQSL